VIFLKLWHYWTKKILQNKFFCFQTASLGGSGLKRVQARNTLKRSIATHKRERKVKYLEVGEKERNVKYLEVGPGQLGPQLGTQLRDGFRLSGPPLLVVVAGHPPGVGRLSAQRRQRHPRRPWRLGPRGGLGVVDAPPRVGSADMSVPRGRLHVAEGRLVGGIGADFRGHRPGRGAARERFNPWPNHTWGIRPENSFL